MTWLSKGELDILRGPHKEQLEAPVIQMQGLVLHLCPQVS